MECEVAAALRSAAQSTARPCHPPLGAPTARRHPRRMRPPAFAPARRATTPANASRTHVRWYAFTMRSNASPSSNFFRWQRTGGDTGTASFAGWRAGLPGSRSAPFPVAVPGLGAWLARGGGGVPKCRFLPVAVRALAGVRRVALQPDVPQRCAGGEGQRAIPGAPRMLGGLPWGAVADVPDCDCARGERGPSLTVGARQLVVGAGSAGYGSPIRSSIQGTIMSMSRSRGSASLAPSSATGCR